MNEYRELLIGCGYSRNKRVFIPGREYETSLEWKNLTTLDIDPACGPDIVFNLCEIEQQNIIHRPLKPWPYYPTGIESDHERQLAIKQMYRDQEAVTEWNRESIMPSNSFNEIHAYEVLEHCGEQGHFKLFFAQFREFWRILKPNGHFCATVPDYKSIWAWGDPSHTRVINAGTLVFLSKKQYEKQVGKTAMSDFRSLMKDMDFDIVQTETVGETFRFVLRAIK